MDREQALKIVKEQITDHRYVHTLGVVETAVWLAEKYGADVKKAELAAIFHDYAKFRPKQEMAKIIKEQQMDPRLLSFHSELWHAPVGAYLVRKEAGIEDEEVLDAIRFHTSGRTGMTLLEQVVYLADYIEPGRHFPGVDEVRQMAEEDGLQAAVIQAVKNTIHFLMKKNQPIFPDTFDTYNDLVTNKEEQH
ncbi:putative HD superfamily hydrolase involved in NAD metabolism [Bacillus ectoiniformans]|uniref:bis(5'-nucleosyl)-tetraphosphatase (symmetrical) YqeK n=1 Tax=Bacillus ectoiniformans TaxID=1494429 RepID=UPI0019596D97|nr:bis(5'-nucleosyl)-tetraphosphatase (symmetrical) YqeK [Bacillus ectoiniformans]MBM7649967.1 putative HD superfamily hydrolase involved in NAD metabolism [Bacillus ectoiniformans]